MITGSPRSVATAGLVYILVWARNITFPKHILMSGTMYGMEVV